jgi:hypothetical protein
MLDVLNTWNVHPHKMIVLALWIKLLNPRVQKLHIDSLVVCHRMLLKKKKPFVKQNKTEFTNISSFTSLLMCSTHCKLYCAAHSVHCTVQHALYTVLYSTHCTLYCVAHIAQSCRILPFPLPTYTNNFFFFFYSEIIGQSACQVLFRPPSVALDGL